MGRGSVTLLTLLGPTAITMQEWRGHGALTGCQATARRWWYLPYVVVGLSAR